MVLKLYEMLEKNSEVWCLLRGKGKVVKIITTKTHEPAGIYVKFKDNEIVHFTLDGKICDRFNQSLFPSEPLVTHKFIPMMRTGIDMVITQKISGDKFIGHILKEHEFTVDCIVKTERFSFNKKEYMFSYIGESISV